MRGSLIRLVTTRNVARFQHLGSVRSITLLQTLTNRKMTTGSLSEMSGESSVDKWNECLDVPLKDADPEIFKLIKAEEQRQYCSLELIASEVHTS